MLRNAAGAGTQGSDACGSLLLPPVLYRSYSVRNGASLNETSRRWVKGYLNATRCREVLDG